MMLSVIIPTHNRPEELARTLREIGALDAAELSRVGAEVIVVDNASTAPAICPPALTRGLPVSVIRLEENLAAAARNIAAADARGQWLLMLDDDSHPLDAGFLRAIADAPPDVGAIGAEIILPDGAHESGGLPEVFIGCGALIRREAFLAAEGYDPTFHFYAEEYDLAAKLLLGGFRITHDARFRVLHRKVIAGRDMNVIIARLIRNNAWVEQRYAPTNRRAALIAATIQRYRGIGEKENALEGCDIGVGELADTLSSQPRREMSPELYDRFTGLAAARDHLRADFAMRHPKSVALTCRGKNDWAVAQAIRDLDVPIIDEAARADARIIATLSPGPILDAMSAGTGGRLRVPIVPAFRFEHWHDVTAPHRSAA
jgi:GT2 family glycosyltransferase